MFCFVLFVLRRRGGSKRRAGIGAPRAQKRSSKFGLEKLADSGQRRVARRHHIEGVAEQQENIEVPHGAAANFPRAKAYRHINPLIIAICFFVVLSLPLCV